MKDVEEKISKIKSFENIVNASQIIEEKMAEIEETKKYSDKNAAKVESMFLEINDKVAFMKKNVDKIDKNEAILQDSTKDIEKIKFEIEQELIKKKQLDVLLDSVKDIIIEEVVGINPVAFDNLRRRVTIMENEKKDIHDLDDERKKLGILEDQVERDYQMGRLKPESYEEIKRSISKKVDEIEIVSEMKQGSRKTEHVEIKRSFFSPEKPKTILEIQGSEKTEQNPEQETPQTEEKPIKKRKERPKKEKRSDKTPLKKRLLEEAKRERKK
jgi:hypothetical protein